MRRRRRRSRNSPLAGSSTLSEEQKLPDNEFRSPRGVPEFDLLQIGYWDSKEHAGAAACPMLSHEYRAMNPVKTTLEIPDAVFRRAKARAAEQGIPLRRLARWELSRSHVRDEENVAGWRRLRLPSTITGSEH